MSYRVAVVGATGAVGREIMAILEEVEFPVSEIFAVASRKSMGMEVAPITHADDEIRLASVNALAEIATPGAMQQLEKALDDHSRDVRVAVTRAFGTRTHRPALSRIESTKAA